MLLNVATFITELEPQLRKTAMRDLRDVSQASEAVWNGMLRMMMYSVPEGLAEAVKKFLAQTEIPAVRKTKTGMKPCDIRPMIYDLKARGDSLKMVLALSEQATCKPDLLLSSLFEFAGTERPRALITRTQLLGEKDGALAPLESL